MEIKSSKFGSPIGDDLTENGSSNWSRPLLIVVSIILAAAKGFALLQPPKPNAFSDNSFSDYLVYPIENSAFLRLPEIRSRLNDVHVSKDDSKIWVVGDGGLIIHSADGGDTWVKQNPVSAEINNENLKASRLLDGVIKAAHAEESPIKAYPPQTVESVKAPPKPPQLFESTQAPPKSPQRVLPENTRPKPPTFISTGDGKDITNKPTPDETLKQQKQELIADDSNTKKEVNKKAADLDSIKQEEEIQTDEERLQVYKYNLNSVFFLDDRLGWVAGDNGTVLMTENGGAEWRIASVSVNQHLYSIVMADRDIGWAVGDRGAIVSTRDGGKEWQRYDPVVNSELRYNVLRSVHYTNASTGLRQNDADKKYTVWAAGDAGVVLTDATGELRNRKTQVDANFISVFFDATGHGRIIASDGSFLFTDNGGREWDTEFYAKDKVPDIKSINNAFVSRDLSDVWLVSDGRRILYYDGINKDLENRNSGTKYILGTSHDKLDGSGLPDEDKSGKTVVQGEDTESVEFTAVYFSSSDNGWVVDNQGDVLSTDDGGENWVVRTRSGRWSELGAKYSRYPAFWYYLFLIAAVVVIFNIPRFIESPNKQRKTIADRLVSDRPLSRNETDVLGLTSMADGISRFIRNTRTEPPLTIAVTGAWGSGKSSLMNLLKEDLDERSYRPVWFNAWHHQKGENLLASLVANIRSQGVPHVIARGSAGFRWRLLLLRGWRNWYKSAAMLMLLVASLGFILHVDNPVEGVANTVKNLRSLEFEALGLGVLGGVLIPLIALMKAIQAFGLNPKSMVDSMTEGMRRRTLVANPGARFKFAHEFHDVTKALGPRKMVIFIDDLDRCQPDHVVEVLEVVNYLMTSGRCFVILGMDPRYVETCVGLNFEVLAKAAASNGGNATDNHEGRNAFARHYMEKLVNLRVTIPAMTDDMSQELLLFKQSSESADSKSDRLFGLLSRHSGWVLCTVFFFTVVLLGWLSGSALSEKINNSDQSPAEIPVEFNTVLHSITFLDKARGVAVGEDGAILLTVDGGETWRTNKGETINILQKDTTQVGNKEKVPSSAETVDEVIGSYVEKSAYFEQGAANSSVWPKYVLPVLALFGMLSGIVALARKPAVTEEDSPLFINALSIWQPWITLRRQTPRLLKRFVNEVRYLAMQYRMPETDDIDKSWLQLLKRKIGIQTFQPEEVDDGRLNEANIVALSAIHQVNTEWVSDAEKFKSLIDDGSVHTLLKSHFQSMIINGGAEIDEKDLIEISKRLDEALTKYIQSGYVLNDYDREQFLNAWNGIRGSHEAV